MSIIKFYWKGKWVLGSRQFIFGLILGLLLLGPFRNLFLTGIETCLAEGEGAPVEILHADQLEFRQEEQVIIGQGNVDIKQKDMRVKADWAKFDLEEEKVFAEGNVILYEGGVEFHGESLVYNLKTEKGILTKPYFFLDPWFCEGEKMVKVAEGEYHLKRGSFTTCDLCKPHYRFTARRMKIYPGKRWWAYHTIFWLGNIPLFYLPIYRRSLRDVPYGFVMWPIGHDSKKGWFALTHYNWYVNPRLRGRIYLDYFEKLGYGKGLDTHYRFGGPDREGAGFFYSYFIDESSLVWDETRGRWEHGPDIERWKLHLRHRQKLSEDTTALLRIDRFSDADFNIDYEDRERWKRFTREELEDQSPEGSLSITKSRPDYTLQAYFRKRINDFVGVITEKLPEISLDLNRQRLGRSPFYWDGDAGLVYFHEAPQGDEAVQADVHLEISRPSRIGWLRLEPAVGGRGFWYSKDRYGRRNRWMGNYELSLGMNTTMYSPIFQPRKIQMRHLIQPRLTYYYSPEPTKNREDLFPFVDRLSPGKDYIDIELINRLVGREADGVRDLAIFTLSTQFYRNNLGRGRHAWGDLVGDLEIRPTEKLSFDGEATYDVNTGRLKKFSTSFSWKEKKWDIYLGMNYYDPVDARANFDTEVTTAWQINPKWKIELYSRYDWSGDHDRTTNWRIGGHHEEWRIALTRDLHCWEGKVFVQREWRREEEDELTISLAFRLKAAPWRPLEIPIR
ncbi:LPS assembly protein LptD [candidate division NPL-UPA2 bacterium]|nr:LPS assembly protein LptD [candidate division NPL-UPA2 bacterium]